MCSEDFAERLVEKVGSGMVVFNLTSSFCVYKQAEALAAVSRDALCNMDCKVVFLDGVDDIDLLAAFRKDVSCISYLSTHLCIERSAFEYELEHCLVLCLYCTVAGKLNTLKLCVVITEELDIVAVCELNPVA